MLRRLRKFIVPGLMSGGGDGFGPEQTLTVQAGIDCSLQSNAVDTNNGGGVSWCVGNWNSVPVRTERGLVKFTTGVDMTGAKIISATLSLYTLANNAANARTFRVYRVKRAWVELQSTWSIYSTGNAWATAGCAGVADVESTAIGAANYVAAEAANSWKDYVLTPTTWETLELGNGWLIKADTETSDAHQVAAFGNATAGIRPKLTLKYRLPL